MPKLGMESIRKHELSRATIAVIHESGLAEPTLSAICSWAGLSTGIVNHYFGGKQGLLDYTVREVVGSFIGEITLRVGSANSAIDRIYAIVDANFAPSQCTPEAISVWLWFWARIPSNPTFAEIGKATDDHVLEQLERALQQLIPEEEVSKMAEGILALMYGFWIRFAHDPDKVSVEDARSITMETLTSRLSTFKLKGKRAEPI
jgi:TetR/AcrR family transcriptional repressor of bet genes